MTGRCYSLTNFLAPAAYLASLIESLELYMAAHQDLINKFLIMCVCARVCNVYNATKLSNCYL